MGGTSKKITLSKYLPVLDSIAVSVFVLHQKLRRGPCLLKYHAIWNQNTTVSL
mgnify:CR=1 FL=1